MRFANAIPRGPAPVAYAEPGNDVSAPVAASMLKADTVLESAFDT